MVYVKLACVLWVLSWIMLYTALRRGCFVSGRGIMSLVCMYASIMMSSPAQSANVPYRYWLASLLVGFSIYVLIMLKIGKKNG